MAKSPNYYTSVDSAVQLYKRNEGAAIYSVALFRPNP